MLSNRRLDAAHSVDHDTNGNDVLVGQLDSFREASGAAWIRKQSHFVGIAVTSPQKAEVNSWWIYDVKKNLKLLSAVTTFGVRQLIEVDSICWEWVSFQLSRVHDSDRALRLLHRLLQNRRRACEAEENFRAAVNQLLRYFVWNEIVVLIDWRNAFWPSVID